jgi:hypothetical protein
MLSRDAFHRARAQLHFARGDGARAHRHLAKCGFGSPLEDALGRVFSAEQSFVEGLAPQPNNTKAPNKINELPNDVNALLQSSPLGFLSPRSPLLPIPPDKRCCMGPNLWAREATWTDGLLWDMRTYAAIHWREVLQTVLDKLEPLTQGSTYADAHKLLSRIAIAAEDTTTTADKWGLGVALFRHTHPRFKEPHAQAKLRINDPRKLVAELEGRFPDDYASALANYADLTLAMLAGMQGITDLHEGEGYTLIS